MENPVFQQVGNWFRSSVFFFNLNGCISIMSPNTEVLKLYYSIIFEISEEHHRDHTFQKKRMKKYLRKCSQVKDLNKQKLVF